MKDILNVLKSGGERTAGGYRLAVRAQEKAARAVLWVWSLVILAALVAILFHVLSRGLTALSLDFLLQSPRRAGREGGIFDPLIATAYLSALALLIAVPVGVGSAIYLAEYAGSGPLAGIARFGIDALAGVPSIIYGLFGLSFFVIALRLGWSMLSGALTLALMLLPTIVRAAEEAIRAVPASYREGSLALGATRWQTIRRVVLPGAGSGILTGVVLSLGRAAGETAAVILTAGSSLGIPLTPLDPARTLSVHLYILATEGLSEPRAYGTAASLIIGVLAANLAVGLLGRRLRPRSG